MVIGSKKVHIAVEWTPDREKFVASVGEFKNEMVRLASTHVIFVLCVELVQRACF